MQAVEKLRKLNRKLWKFLKVFSFLVYGIICLTEGIKLYHRFVQDDPIPQWSIYLFLSVAILIPGLLGFATKNKGAGTRFFVGTGRGLVSVALLFACILSQRGLEREKGVVIEPPQIASHTLQSPQSKEEDARLAFRESNEIKPAPVIDTTPPSLIECVMNGKKYYSDLPFDIIEMDVKKRCLKSVFAYGSDKH
jgi:hypothetical protein